MIWIGTSGWIYPHWVGRFYPPALPAREHLAYYAQYFPTVEINRSFYRLPTYAQFQTWGEQVQHYPGFLFAVKAADESEIRATLQQDPWSKSGMLEVKSIQPWTILLESPKR